MTGPSSVPELTVALPAYEEGANLNQLIPRLHETLTALHIPYEIIVVDTETPPDDTPAICARHGARYLPREGGPLYSHAVRTALAASRGRRVVLMDADGSHGPGFVANLWAERDGADLVIASRYMPGGRTENPAILIFLSLTVNVVFRLVLGLRCADVSNSFRLYHGDDLRALTLECENFDIVEEILVKLCCARPGYRVKEIPFTFEKRKAGRTKRNLLRFALSYAGTLWRLTRLKRRVQRALS
jgi:dolichol-phosphate mannosyltransferase